MNVDPDDFDFTDVGVTEAEYYSLLDDFRDHPAVRDISHSLPLNELRLTLAADVTSDELAEIWPPDLTIRRIGYTDDGDIEVDLRTTRYLATEADTAEYFPADYTDEAMAYCAVQLSLFDAVAATDLVRGAEQLHVRVELTDTFKTSYIFNELQTLLGYTITGAAVADGQIRRLLFSFDETRPFTDETPGMFEASKLRTLRNAAFDDSDPVTAPCGHSVTPQLLTFQDVRDELLTQFPTVSVAGVPCYNVSATDDGAFLRVTDWPDGVNPVNTDSGSIPVAFARGYRCSTCETAYPAVDETVLHDQSLAADVTPDPVDYAVSPPETEATYTFSIIEEPYLPIEYQ